MNRTIKEKAKSLLNKSRLSSGFWGEAVMTATYLINRIPTKAVEDNKTPYELWHRKKPLLKYLRVFGSIAYVLNKANKTKFEDKSWKGIFVGYHVNGYRIWNIQAKKIEIARDVIFNEEVNKKVDDGLKEIVSTEELAAS